MGPSEAAFAPTDAYIEEAAPSVSARMLLKLYFYVFQF